MYFVHQPPHLVGYNHFPSSCITYTHTHMQKQNHGCIGVHADLLDLSCCINRNNMFEDHLFVAIQRCVYTHTHTTPRFEIFAGWKLIWLLCSPNGPIPFLFFRIPDPPVQPEETLSFPSPPIKRH